MELRFPSGNPIPNQCTLQALIHHPYKIQYINLVYANIAKSKQKPSIHTSTCSNDFLDLEPLQARAVYIHIYIYVDMKAGATLLHAEFCLNLFDCTPPIPS